VSYAGIFNARLRELFPSIHLMAVFYGAGDDELARHDLGKWYQDHAGVVCPCDPRQMIDVPAEAVRFDLISRGNVLKSVSVSKLLAGAP
jgi:hypothetical protein